jgi:lipoyl(octanoyl) transferase
MTPIKPLMTPPPQQALPALADAGPGRCAWQIASAPVDYPPAVAAMEARARAIREGRAGELVWLLEHPPLYTAGTSATPGDLLAADRFPVYRTGRGGQYTYHGPGQRVAYVMLDLDRRGRRDVRRFVHDLEEWLIAALARFSILGERRPGRVGIWVDRGRHPGSGGLMPGREDKIAAIGVRVRRWVTFHGIALNVEPDLAHFSGIVPCGIRGHGVTSLVDLGLPVTMADADLALRAAFEAVFGPVADPAPGEGSEAHGTEGQRP